MFGNEVTIELVKKQILAYLSKKGENENMSISKFRYALGHTYPICKAAILELLDDGLIEKRPYRSFFGAKFTKYELINKFKY